MTARSAPQHVVLAPDSFKGTASALQVCAALRAGWLSVRPQDDIRSVPFSDGGEGLLDAVEAVVAGSRRRLAPGVRGPDGRPVDAQWLELPGGQAVVELAQASGLSHMRHLDVWGATTYGTGEVVRAAVLSGATSVVLGLGGSASVDGGLGVLQALGLRFLRGDGVDVVDGARGTAQAAQVLADELVPAPPGGILALTDVRNPLLGPDGAAAVFGPQKGADESDVAGLEGALVHWAALLGVDDPIQGHGAAGGVVAGLSAYWPTTIAPGAAWVAELVGLEDLCRTADLIISGEGTTFDSTSHRGKVVGHVLDAARRNDASAALVAGRLQAPAPDDVTCLSLVDLAPTAQAATTDCKRWLERAGAQLAEQWKS